MDWAPKTLPCCQRGTRKHTAQTAPPHLMFFTSSSSRRASSSLSFTSLHTTQPGGPVGGRLGWLGFRLRTQQRAGSAGAIGSGLAWAAGAPRRRTAAWCGHSVLTKRGGNSCRNRRRVPATSN